MPIDVIRSKIVIAGLSYIQPVFQADYLQIRVIAEVTMPDVLNVDIVTPTDLVTLSTTKALSDTTNGFVDRLSYINTKGFVDLFTVADASDIIFAMQKTLSDTQGLTDFSIRAVEKGLAESLASVDLAAKAFTKPLFDAVTGIYDDVARSTGKGLTDSFTMEDSVDIEYWIEKNLAETQAIADLAAITSDKPFIDSSAISDSIANTAQKGLDDLLNSPIDSISAIDVVKGLSESQAIADSIQTTLIFIRDVADTLVSSDLAALTSIFENSEILATSDDDTLSVSKGLTEELNLIDNMDGDIEYNIVKLVGELLASTDSPAIAFATQMSDNAVTSSSGVLAMQDYSDITYFLEDYVGTSRTFT